MTDNKTNATRPSTRDCSAEWAEMRALLASGKELPAPLDNIPLDFVIPSKGEGWGTKRTTCGICCGDERLGLHEGGGWMCHGGSCYPGEEFIGTSGQDKPTGGDLPRYLQAIATARSRETNPAAEVVGFKEVAEALASIGITGPLDQVKQHGGKPLTLDEFSAAPQKNPSGKKRLSQNEIERIQQVRNVLARREEAGTQRADWAAAYKDSKQQLPEMPFDLRTPNYGAAGDQPPRAAFASAEEARPWVEKRGLRVIKLKGKKPVGKWETQASDNFEEYSKWCKQGFNLGIHAKLSKRIFLDLDRKNFLKVLANIELPALEEGKKPNGYRLAVEKAKQLDADKVQEAEDWMMGFVQQAAEDADGLIHPTPGGGWHIEFLDDGDTLSVNAAGNPDSNVNLSQRECPLRWEQGWCDTRCGNGQVVLYKRDPALLDKEPRPCPDYLKEYFKAPRATTISEADYELLQADLDETEAAVGGNVIESPEAPGPKRLYDEAMSRLHPIINQILKDFRKVKLGADGQKTYEWVAGDVVAEYFKHTRMRFFKDAGKDIDDDDLRKGGAFRIKPKEKWEQPRITQTITDILRLIGTDKAQAVESQLKAIKNRLASLFHAGDLTAADAVIPTSRRLGVDKNNPIPPMVLDAADTAISLAPGSCGSKATQHDDYPLMRRLNVVHDPKATCPIWDEKVHWAMQNKEGGRSDKEVRERVHYLEELLAMPLYNGPHGNEHQEWVFFQGTGGNFKGGALDLMEHLYGDFFIKLKAAPFFQGRYSGDEKIGELQNLEGKWCAVIGEAPKYKEWKSELIKDATGGRTLTVRPMNKPERTFPNSWFLYAQGNVIPRSPDSSRGWGRRRHILIFDNEVARSDQDPKLAQKLVLEASGIFNRLLAALDRIHKNGGIIVPQHIEDIKEEYEKSEEPIIARFVDQYIIPKKGKNTSVADAHKQFKIFKSQEENRTADFNEEHNANSFRMELQQKLGANRVFYNKRQWMIRDCVVETIEGGTRTPPDVGGFGKEEAPLKGDDK